MRAKFPYKKRRKRLGCGIGSGHGKTSTKGHKGQRARSGFALRPGFEGGQNPLYRRLPKRGFNNAEFKRAFAIVNLDQIALLEPAEITPEVLKNRGFLKNDRLPLKILGTGELKKAVTVKAHRFSESAKAKIEKAGGKAVIL
ncbi:MAG: 50S ribosomal protein L15 [Candidatus Omnitrophica bacterium]|nr:50S ribosomal protein L15 [Candidatus Omnitrophota bacterium]